MSPLAPGRNGSDPGERGFALLIVLWSLVLLAFLGSQMAAAGRGETQLSANLRNGAVAEAAAEGAVHEALFHLLDSSNRHWRADGLLREIRFPNALVQLRIRSEAGKVNPNTASPELLQALLHAVGADQRSAASIAAAITEWRFPDAQSRASQYRAMGHGYGPPGAPFETIGELGLVLGMTPELLARLSPHLSLYHDGEADPAAADPVVLQAMRALGSVPPSAGVADEIVLAITAAAEGVNGTRFVRRAVVRLGGPDRGRPYRILTWESGAS